MRSYLEKQEQLANGYTTEENGSPSLCVFVCLSHMCDPGLPVLTTVCHVVTFHPQSGGREGASPGHGAVLAECESSPLVKPSEHVPTDSRGVSFRLSEYRQIDSRDYR